MPSLKFFGKVEPPWYELNFDYRPEFKHQINEIDVGVTCRVEITSQ